MCLACGHAVPHNRGDYEDTHLRCEHEEPERYVGSDCGHKKYNAKCDEKDDEGGCWTLNVDCRCSEEDRLIADLSSTIATLRKALERKDEALRLTREHLMNPKLTDMAALCLAMEVLDSAALDEKEG